MLDEKQLNGSTLSQNKKNIIIILLQGILFWEKLPLAKVTYWEEANCLLWFMCLREPSACAMQSLAPRYEGQFPYVDLSSARQLVVHCSVLVSQLHPNPQQRDLSYYTQILAFLPCRVVCEIEHSLFMCITLFPAGNLRSSHMLPHWNLRLCLAN